MFNAGNNLRVFQNVTCGTRNGVEYPKIGNNVTLFSGCFVGGGITIGDNVKVGANAVVLNIDKPPYAMLYTTQLLLMFARGA